MITITITMIVPFSNARVLCIDLFITTRDFTRRSGILPRTCRAMRQNFAAGCRSYVHKYDIGVVALKLNTDLQSATIWVEQRHDVRRRFVAEIRVLDGLCSHIS